MSKFFVGQRVRLVGEDWPHSDASPKGAEGRITSRRSRGQSGRIYDWEVTTDSRDHIAADSHELEPILPEGAAPSEYSFQGLMNRLQEVSA